MGLMLLKNFLLNLENMNIFVIAFAAFLLAFTAPTKVWAQSSITPTIYMVKGKETIDSIAVKLLPRFKVKYNKRIEEFKKNLKEWNPQITEWNPIPLFSNLYVDYPYPVYISHPYAEKLEANRNYNILNSDAETPLGTNDYTVYAMYTASSGEFKEKPISSQGSIKSNQNSPFSLGIGSTFLMDKTNRMISASAYWSMLRASNLKGDEIATSEIEVKAEYGFNVYYQQLTPWAELSLFGGVDFEQFSTFNTNYYLEGEDLDLNQNKLTFATVGASRTFFWNDQKILLKASVSQSVLSDTTSKEPSINEYKGQRFMLFSSFKGDNRITYHVLFKRHMLDGPTNLTINRIGIGIGFVIF